MTTIAAAAAENVLISEEENWTGATNVIRFSKTNAYRKKVKTSTQTELKITNES